LKQGKNELHTPRMIINSSLVAIKLSVRRAKPPLDLQAKKPAIKGFNTPTEIVLFVITLDE